MNKIVKLLVTLCGAIQLSVIVTAAQPNIAIEEYARQVFIRGVPYEQTLLYDQSAVPVLRAMLNDPAESAHWANVSVMLEMIGSEEVLDDIIRFIEQDPGGEYTVEYHRAKTGAIMGLGYLINRTGSKKALNYLVESLSPTAWESRAVEGLSQLHTTYEERNMDMSKYAMLGLALSGKPVAADALRSLKTSKFFGNSEYQRQVGGLVDEVIAENTKIAQMGLTEYYRAH